MCTYLTDYIQKMAIEDVKTYKVVMVKDGEYYAPFRGQEYVYEPNIPATAPLQTTLKQYKTPTDRYVADVSYGIHSFRTVSSAIRYLNMIVRYSPNRQKEYAILESEVPEGAHYYEGHAEFGDALVNYVANAIVSDILIPRENEIDLETEEYRISW